MDPCDKAGCRTGCELDGSMNAVCNCGDDPLMKLWTDGKTCGKKKVKIKSKNQDLRIYKISLCFEFIGVGILIY